MDFDHEGITKEENNSYVVFKQNQLGNRAVVRGGGVTPPAPRRIKTQASGQILKDDVDGFSST
jgi:hypothetical protein